MSCETPYLKQFTTPIFDPIQEMWVSASKVPCGKCLTCKKTKVLQWSHRMQQELKVSYSAYFVTLTYNTESVPITDKGFMTLVKTKEQNDKLKDDKNNEVDRSMQGFVKRLRAAEEYDLKTGKVSFEQYKRVMLSGQKNLLFNTKPLKFYGCGEYGERRKRPHYHLILFNVMDTKNITESWKFGNVHIDDVNSNTIEYCVKYINKEEKIPYKWFDGIPEFSLMSKGIGKNYINDQAKDWHKQEYNNYVVVNGKVKVPTPRYYNNKLYDKATKEKKIKYLAKEAEKKLQENRKLANKHGEVHEKNVMSIHEANKIKLKKMQKRDAD